MENQILSQDTARAADSLECEKNHLEPAPPTRLIAAEIGHRPWLKEVLLHAVGHAFGAAIVGAAAILLTMMAVAPAAKVQAPSCSAPTEFSNPKVWTGKA
jgi:hypothetical protein